ncbi:Hypothetical protein I5071_28480 [Sandaracinus amylolyticus]|nr:Hypothetical protein I5071_28480 [Sandaracinus amylolyticus]
MTNADSAGMTPVERARERLVLPFDRGSFARDAVDSTVAYVGVEHAPPGASRTRRAADGTLTLETRLVGRVGDVGPQGFVVEHAGFPARVRHLLPAALELRALGGHDVSLDLEERLHAGRCTVDARVRDRDDGALVLWTHDGELPEDRVAHGLALRMRMGDEARGLVIAHRGGLVIVRAPSVVAVDTEVGPMLFVVLRLGDEDVAFVALAS